MLIQATQDALFEGAFSTNVALKGGDTELAMTASEIEELVDPVIVDAPTVLIEHMSRSLGRFKEIQSLRDSEMVSNSEFALEANHVASEMKISAVRAKKESLKEFRENVCWVFGLYATPSIMEFDQACLIAGQDPEWIRDGISRTFGDDIRCFYKQVKAILPDCGERMRKMLKGYVSLQEN